MERRIETDDLRYVRKTPPARFDERDLGRKVIWRERHEVSQRPQHVVVDALRVPVLRTSMDDAVPDAREPLFAKLWFDRRE